MIALAFALLTSAHAGWFADQCQRVLDSLVTNDPWAYELATDVWIDAEIDRLQIRQRWHAATKDDLDHLAILRNERARRIEIDSIIHPNERPKE